MHAQDTNIARRLPSGLEIRVWKRSASTYLSPTTLDPLFKDALEGQHSVLYVQLLHRVSATAVIPRQCGIQEIVRHQT